MKELFFNTTLPTASWNMRFRLHTVNFWETDADEDADAGMGVGVGVGGEDDGLGGTDVGSGGGVDTGQGGFGGLGIGNPGSYGGQSSVGAPGFGGGYDSDQGTAADLGHGFTDDFSLSESQTTLDRIVAIGKMVAGLLGITGNLGLAAAVGLGVKGLSMAGPAGPTTHSTPEGVAQAAVDNGLSAEGIDVSSGGAIETMGNNYLTRTGATVNQDGSITTGGGTVYNPDGSINYLAGVDTTNPNEVNLAMYQQSRADFQPFYNVGLEAIPTYNSMLNGEYQPEESPYYKYLMQKSREESNLRESVTGGTGNEATRLANIAMGAAANDWQTQYSRILDALKLGTGASDSMGQTGSQYASNALTASGQQSYLDMYNEDNKRQDRSDLYRFGLDVLDSDIWDTFA